MSYDTIISQAVIAHGPAFVKAYEAANFDDPDDLEEGFYARQAKSNQEISELAYSLSNVTDDPLKRQVYEDMGRRYALLALSYWDQHKGID